MDKNKLSTVVYELPQDVQEQLILALGKHEETKRFIRMVGHELGKFNAFSTDRKKMKKQDEDYKQINKLYTKAKELYQAIKAVDDTAWQRLSGASWLTSSPWGGPPTRERSLIEVLDLLGAAGATLDQQTLKTGEKGTYTQTEVSRVRIIAFCFECLIKKYKVTCAEDSPFHNTVQIILRFDHSPKALIKKILPS